jgi:hypothetical protein
MKNIITTLLLCVLVKFSFAQIWKELSAVKKEYWPNYEQGYTEPNEKGNKLYYIAYETKKESEASGKYTEIKVMYFFDDKPDAICIKWKIIEPITETNPNVKYFNRELVRLKEMLWKDYETGLLYQLEVGDGLCIISCYYDFNND